MDNYKKIEGFIDKNIWVTRKSRIEAEARMIRNHNFLQFTLVYYTFFILAFSIWLLVTENYNISIFTVILSVGLFGFNIYFNSIGFNEKALKYKESYLELTQLQYKMEQLLDEEEGIKTEEFHDLKSDYQQILSKTDNHSELDYLKVLIKHNNLTSIRSLLYFYTFNFIKYAVFTCILVLPLILIIFVI
ncbi:SLATT domain-containing protein [Alkalibacillus haloalkaliphilus]|uniref:SMODS and SLOG-associating 2TM effector domain-containing protein n=1 Tax=Alkalibacillus haloalkaliphilus TaxID=94136 RepID=A0A511W275_9BACI|nr:SLATT domain-containing protein [Alkalibacillus haloalkaliphilus]GEN44468.1 hypothetical protein AHA02nite_02440 [Alkalibacillus haloalkaliphilus]